LHDGPEFHEVEINHYSAEAPLSALRQCAVLTGGYNAYVMLPTYTHTKPELKK